WDASRDDEHLAALLESALAALGGEDSTLRVKLLARLAGGPLRDSTADVQRRESLGAQALEMARRIGDPPTLAHALFGYINSHLSPDGVPEQLELAKELVEVASETGDIEREVEGLEVRFESSIELGDLATAHEDLDTMTALATDLRQPAQTWLVGAYQAVLALLEGRFEEAEQLIEETRSLGERVVGWNAAVTHGLQLYVLRLAQGRVHEVEELVRRAARDYSTFPIWRCVLANMTAELGSASSARSELEALSVDGFGGLPFDEEWDASLCLLAETAARLGERGHAEALYELLLPYADRVAYCYAEISVGPISRSLGILAATTERWDDAERHFKDSLQLNERIGARPWLARTRDDYGRMLLERGGPGDREKAQELLSAAVATYRECGMDAYALKGSKALKRASASA